MTNLTNHSKRTNITSCDQVLSMFDIADEHLVYIKQQILKEFELGLRNEEAATIKMLITYVRDMSKGDEVGSYLALDLGGTHFRVLLVELNAGKSNVTTSVHTIPQELLVTSHGQELFDYIALKLLDFVQANKLKRRRISLGFTFSFPCKQYGLTQSYLVKWCKGFKVGGVVGTDVVKQLKDALKRQLAGRIEAYIDVVAVINDTTGTMVACANSKPDCRIGLIVGTGFNACYMERLDRCEKWPANYTSPKQVIINCEWGAMGDNKERRELDPFRNEFDVEIDSKSVNPGNQTYEKLTSGMYIGEMLRLVLVRLFRLKLIFVGQSEHGLRGSKLDHQDSTTTSTTANNKSGHKLYIKDILDGKHISMLGQDELDGSFEQSRKILEHLCIDTYSERDLAFMVQMGSRIIRRSASMVAVGICALLERIAKPHTVIGFDGSVIKHHPFFLRVLEQKTAQLLSNKDLNFEFMQSSDGSGIGAAVVAAALHKERRPLYVVKPRRVYELHYPVRGPNSTSSKPGSNMTPPSSTSQ